MLLQHLCIRFFSSQKRFFFVSKMFFLNGYYFSVFLISQAKLFPLKISSLCFTLFLCNCGRGFEGERGNGFTIISLFFYVLYSSDFCALYNLLLISGVSLCILQSLWCSVKQLIMWSYRNVC